MCLTSTLAWACPSSSGSSSTVARPSPSSRQSKRYTPHAPTHTHATASTPPPAPPTQELYTAGLYTILPHAKFGLLLFLVLLLMLAMLSAARFRLNRLSGCSLVVLYLLFLAYAFTQDLACLKGVYC